MCDPYYLKEISESSETTTMTIAKQTYEQPEKVSWSGGGEVCLQTSSPNSTNVENGVGLVINFSENRETGNMVNPWYSQIHIMWMKS